MGRVECWNFTRGGVEAARAEGFTEEELDVLRQCVRRRYACELEYRLAVLPTEIRERIVRDTDSDVFIPVFNDKEATLDGYFLLPIRDIAEPNLLHILIVPPIATEWGVVRRNYSGELLQWLREPVSGRALSWINAMLGEFCVPANDSSKWRKPPVGGRIAMLRAHAEFWKSLHRAQQCEANLRFAAAIHWLEERGMDGLVDTRNYAVIRSSADDYDPEHSTFIFSIRLRRERYCLILKPRGQPLLCLKSYCEVRRIISAEEWRVQQDWLKSAALEAQMSVGGEQ